MFNVAWSRFVLLLVVASYGYLLAMCVECIKVEDSISSTLTPLQEKYVGKECVFLGNYFYIKSVDEEKHTAIATSVSGAIASIPYKALRDCKEVSYE